MNASLRKELRITLLSAQLLYGEYTNLAFYTELLSVCIMKSFTLKIKGLDEILHTKALFIEKLPTALGQTVKKGNPDFEISSVICKDTVSTPTYEITLDSESETCTTAYKTDGTLISKVKNEYRIEDYENSDSVDGD